MYYKIQLKDHIRVAPKYFSNNVEEAVIKAVREKFAGFIDEELGFVIDVLGVNEVGDGVIIPGDGAAYYETTFELITFQPEEQRTTKQHSN
jgi:DNA-directed RNA polymerase subunit E'